MSRDDKSSKPLHSFIPQLRKSYLTLCIVILLFFLLYSLQTIFVYNRSRSIEKSMLADQQVFNQIQIVKTDLQQLEYYAKDYVLTHDEKVQKKYLSLRINF